MAFEEGTEHLTCTGCGAGHVSKWSRAPVRDHVLLKCQRCGMTLIDRKSVRDYNELTLL